MCRDRMIEGMPIPSVRRPPCRLSNQSCAGLETMKANTTNGQALIILSVDKGAAAANVISALNSLNLADAE